jgi:hypothetical protein
MDRLRKLKLAVRAAVVFATVAGACAASAQTPPPARAPNAAAQAAPADEFKLSGFRSANFGMSADQVRQAIRRDFNIAADKIETAENGAEKTQILAITVPDLLPGGGPAQIAYVLGFRTRQLVQVTVTWGGPINPQLTAATAIDLARILQGHLTSVGYKTGTIAVNVAQPDGTVIVFRGDDAQGRRTIAVLAGVAAPEGQRPAGPPMLQISYIRDTQNPDVFQIRKGDF